MNQKSAKHVLFVCTGNTCRSPMAERLLIQYLADEGVNNITVSSAGVAAFAGDAMSYETAALLAEQGCSIEGFSSSPVVSQLLDTSDVVLAMTRSHLAALNAAFPECSDKCYLLDSNWVDTSSAKVISNQDIADPIGCGRSAYESVADDFKRIFPNLINWLKNLN